MSLEGKGELWDDDTSGQTLPLSSVSNQTSPLYSERTGKSEHPSSASGRALAGHQLHKSLTARTLTGLVDASFLPAAKPLCGISAGVSQSTELCTSLPTGHLLSAILQLLLCFETERLAAGQPGLVFLSRLQADVCAHRQGWRSLPSPLGSAACGQAAGRACGQPPACSAACSGQLPPEA